MPIARSVQSRIAHAPWNGAGFAIGICASGFCRDAAIPICTFMQINVDRLALPCYNYRMRIIVVLIILLMLASFSYSQEPVPDSADTVYMQLDSLDAGIDLALKALKMRRGDLTFRGDYLEPDEFRMPAIDAYMEIPLNLINEANSQMDNGFPDITYFVLDETCGFRVEKYEELNRVTDDLNELKSETFQNTWKKLLGENGYEVVWRILDFIEFSDIYNCPEYENSSKAEIDSIIEGFTLILEEDEEDEFKSVEEIDSLSQMEDEWAKALTRISSKWYNRKKMGDYLISFLTLDEMKIFLAASINKTIPRWGSDLQIKETYSQKTSYGQIIIGDTTDNHYTGDLFIVIDPGGNDTYDIEFEGTGHHTYIIDYGGDDTYNMPQNRISPYFFGSNMIIDYDGDDLYNAGSWTLGAGLFGVGVLWDMKGNDRYYGDTFTMGAGCFGVGILRDDDGNDSYHAALFSQGFGFADGVGVLIDNAGNDNYFAGGKYKDFIRYDDHYLSLSQGFGYGLRPKMSGGVGMLIDKSGNDIYISDIFGQGASYWYGLGMLADGGGNDQYISFQYAQGNGTHMSLGILY
ncbi:MAG: hypothetical protein JSU85_11410, partial [Candidatus Zixiibacteriota bacterium]